MPKWRNWQTRMVQVHVPARAWGFESLLRHHLFFLLAPLANRSTSLFLFSITCFAQGVALTFDDLPLNGDLPLGVTRVEITKSVLAILKARHAPIAYGFVNAKKLEGNRDSVDALKLWVAAGEKVGNH